MPIDEINEYMPNAVARFYSLCMLVPHIAFFMVLGHLPLKEKLSRIFKNISILEIPYPKINRVSPLDAKDKKIDFLFQGALTKYRVKILSKIRQTTKSVFAAFDNNLGNRITRLRNARFVLHIPQYNKWRYISPMRCMQALKYGIPVLNISNTIIHEFDTIFPQINPDELNDQLSKYLTYSQDDFYYEILEKYNNYVETQPKSKLPTMIKLFSDMQDTRKYTQI